MSIATTPNSISFDAPASIRRFTVEEYHDMGKNGILQEDDRVELLEGLVLTKMNHNPPHDSSVDLCFEVLQRHLPPGWRIRIQSAITTNDSEPEPDLAIVRGTARDYSTRHPGPDDVALVIEVAESSLKRDREKCRLYARAGIVQYWIVNVVQSQIEAFSDPSGPIEPSAFRQQQTYRLNDVIPFGIDGQEIGQIPVHDLLP